MSATVSDQTVSPPQGAATPTYEYRTVQASPARASLVRDTYAAFGWEGDGRAMPSPVGEVTIKIKRKRHIKNRPMVNELQRCAEASLAEIDRLERTKTTRARIWALGSGLVGSALLALSVFAFTWEAWVLFVLCGVAGLGVVGATFPLYLSQRDKATRAATPLIDQQHDIVYDACEQAQMLLA